MTTANGKPDSSMRRKIVNKDTLIPVGAFFGGLVLFASALWIFFTARADASEARAASQQNAAAVRACETRISGNEKQAAVIDERLKNIKDQLDRIEKSIKP